ncbi:MAG: gas vesicle protein K [Myxococcota bacterium]
MEWGNVRGKASDVEAILGVMEASKAPEPRRIHVDPNSTQQGLLQLVLSVVELLRRLLERQAMRRMTAGSVTDEEAERMGVALQRLQEQITVLCKENGIDDLNLDLGPLGRLLD